MKMRLESIETQAFSGSFDFSNGPIELLRLPGSLKIIRERAFAYLNDEGRVNGNYAINEVQFGGPNDPWTLDLNSNNIGNTILVQHPLDVAPNLPNSSTNTPIGKYTLYKDPSATEPTEETFRAFIDGSKCNGNNDITGDFAIIDAEI